MGKKVLKFGRKQVLQLDGVKKQQTYGLGYKPPDKPAESTEGMLGGGHGGVGSFGMLAGYGDSDDSDDTEDEVQRSRPAKPLGMQKLAFIKADVLEPMKPSSPSTSAASSSEKPTAANGTNKAEIKQNSPADEADMKLKAFLSEIDAMDPDEETPSSSVTEVPSQHAEVDGNGYATTDSEDEQESIPEPTQPTEPTTNWQHCLDEDTQHYYYWNTATNEVTWEIPPDYSQYLAQYNEYEVQFSKYEKEKKSWEERMKNVKEKKRKRTSVRCPTPEAKSRDDQKMPIVSYPPTPDELPSSSMAPPLPPSTPTSVTTESRKDKIRALIGFDKTKEEKDSGEISSMEIGPKLPEFGPLPDKPHIGPQLPQDPTAGSFLPKNEQPEKLDGPVLPVIEADGNQQVQMAADSHNEEDADDFDIDKELEQPVFSHYEFINKKFIVPPQQEPPNVAENGEDSVDIEDIDRQLEMALEEKKRELLKLSEEQFKSTGRRKVEADPEGITPAKRQRMEKYDEAISSENDLKTRINASDVKTKVSILAEISDLSSLISDKLEFLEVSKNGLSKLQTIMVEMETRISDWKEGGLTTEHLLGKLREAEVQLASYESSGAPPGWSCHWDRAFKRYFYSNDVTGDSQWDYPVDEEQEETSEVVDAVVEPLPPQPPPPPSPPQPSPPRQQEAEEMEPVDGDMPDSSTGSYQRRPQPPSSKFPAPAVAEYASQSIVTEPPPPPPPAVDTRMVNGAAPPPPPPLSFAHLVAPPPPPPGEPPPPGLEDLAALAPPPPPPEPAASHSRFSNPSSPSHGVSSSDYRFDSHSSPTHASEDMDIDQDSNPPTASSSSTYQSAPMMMRHKSPVDFPCDSNTRATSSSSSSVEHKPAHISARAVLVGSSESSSSVVTESSSVSVTASTSASVAVSSVAPQPMEFAPGADTPPASPASSSHHHGDGPAAGSVSSSSGPQPSTSSAAAAGGKDEKKRKKKDKALISGNLSMKKKRVPSMVEKWKSVQKEVEHEISRKNRPLIPPEDM